MMSSNTIRDKDVLGLQEIVGGQNLEDKIASAGAAKDIYDSLESTKTMLSNVSNKLDELGIMIFRSASNAETTATFCNIPFAHRIPALFIGNGNGAPIGAYCSLFSGVDDLNTSCAIANSSFSISLVHNGDRTFNCTISGVNTWGYYKLLVFY